MSPPGSPYQVGKTARVSAQVRELSRRAADAGITAPFVAGLKRMTARLQSDPLGWGDPEFRTKHKGGVKCHAVCSPLVVFYVVFESERQVCILDVKPLSGSPLDRE